MDFTLDEEQEALRDAVRGLLKGYDPSVTPSGVARSPPRIPGTTSTLEAAGRDGPARAAVRRGRRRHGCGSGRGGGGLRGDRTGARAGAVRRLGGPGRRPGRCARERRAACRDPRWAGLRGVGAGVRRGRRRRAGDPGRPRRRRRVGRRRGGVRRCATAGEISGYRPTTVVGLRDWSSTAAPSTPLARAATPPTPSRW